MTMTETIPGGPDAFQESLREELRPCAPAHHVSFAAVLGERWLPWAGEYADWEPTPGQPSYRYLIKVSSASEYADLAPPLGQGASMRQIIEAVWDHACGQDIAPDRLGEFEADLSEIGVLVDPDRFSASFAYSVIRLLRLTTRCCAPGAGVAAAVTVARDSLYMSIHAARRLPPGIAAVMMAPDSLHMSTGFGFSYKDYWFKDDWELYEKWYTPNVQAEARLQRKLAQTLRTIPRIERDTVEALRRDFVT